MKRYAGVWVDHEKAFVVILYDGKDKLKLIKSNIAGHVRLSGGSRTKSPYGPQNVASERKVEEKRRHHLQDYYQEIIKNISTADKFLIIGPGDAKIELKKEMEKSKELTRKIVKVEPADKMTENQIRAKVKDYFLR
ncbi:MAG: hypothetical protein JSV25_09540 [Spirochaetota bacterium]|nr:MAG: hypothetical protein JSV25_09540 [Spirochaetota bacterium]